MATAYQVGIHLAMTSNHAQVIQALSRDLLGVSATVGQLQNMFGRLGVAIAGAFAVEAGTKFLGVLSDIVKKGSEYEHQLVMLRAAGASVSEVMQAQAKAFEVSAAVQTTTIAENVKHLNELRYAFGDYAKAAEALTAVSKVEAVLAARAPGLKDQVWPMVKALESRGETIDVDYFTNYLDTLTKSALASGGRLTPQMFFQTFKYGRTAGLFWDQSFISGALPRLIQELSGGSGSGGPGNALMSAYQAVIGGVISQQSARLFQELGLLPGGEVSPSGPHRLRLPGGPRVFHTPTGHFTHFDPGAMQGSRLFRENPYEWVQQVLGPAFARTFGIMPGQEISKELHGDIVNYLSQLFRNRTAGQVMEMMLTQGRWFLGEQSPFEKDIRLQHKAMGFEEAFELLRKNDPVTNMRMFEAQWRSMLEALGSTLVPAVIPILQALTQTFTDLGQAIGAHPTLFKYLAEGLAALAVALTAGGIAAIIAALGPAGWIAAGITALVAAVTLIPWRDAFEAIASGLTSLGAALQSFWEKLKSWFGPGTGPGPEHQWQTPPGFAPGSYQGPPFGSLLVPAAYQPAGLAPSGAASLSRAITGPKIPLSVGQPPGGGGDLGPGPAVGTIGAAALGANRRAVAATVAQGWAAAGMSPAGIAGVLANIREESNFNPALRHPDQPHWSGEAHYAHGLYQEGGQEWLNYMAWLGKYHPGADWRDPGLQTAFAAENLKIHYPKVWERMLHAHSAAEAAAAYASGYLKPAAPYLHSRIEKFMSRGVPGIESYTGGAGSRPAMVPPPAERTLQMDVPVYLDGEKIAQSTVRQFVGAFNRTAYGSRLPDYTAIRPQAV